MLDNRGQLRRQREPALGEPLPKQLHHRSKHHQLHEKVLDAMFQSEQVLQPQGLVQGDVARWRRAVVESLPPTGVGPR